MRQIFINFKTLFVGLFSIGSIEILNDVNVQETIKFFGQSVIGILTVVWLLYRIRNEKNKNND